MRILTGDALSILKTLPDKLVQTCITSPPYFGLRDYGVDGQIGLEETPEAYTQKLVDVFRQVRRVLKDDGTLWLNLGDSYNGSGKGQCKDGEHDPKKHKTDGMKLKLARIGGLKHKDLMGIPWRVAFALQVDGWYLRQDIIWHKPNPMPESVTDRCTKAHEYIFLLSKSAKYYYDCDAIREPYGKDQREAGLIRARKYGSETVARIMSYRDTSLTPLPAVTKGRRRRARTLVKVNSMHKSGPCARIKAGRGSAKRRAV